MSIQHSLRLATAFALATLAMAVPRPAAAQGAIVISVIDDETGDPIVGAVIKIKNLPDAATDQYGKARLEGLPAGRIEVDLRAIGYLGRRDYIGIQNGATKEQRFGLAFTGDAMPELVVSARREKLMGRYQDYHRREAAGNGVFIGWSEIAQKGYSRLGDALRNVRGVRVQCRTQDCTIMMARSTQCSPTIWMDGTENSLFGANMPIGDIYGIEVYRGAGEIPAEYAGNSACGAVVLWSKNRPYK